MTGSSLLSRIAAGAGTGGRASGGAKRQPCSWASGRADPRWRRTMGHVEWHHDRRCIVEGARAPARAAFHARAYSSHLPGKPGRYLDTVEVWRSSRHGPTTVFKDLQPLLHPERRHLGTSWAQISVPRPILDTGQRRPTRTHRTYQRHSRSDHDHRKIVALYRGD